MPHSRRPLEEGVCNGFVPQPQSPCRATSSAFAQPGTGFAAAGYPDASFHGAVFG
ncbi:hypothetical protein [Armatimonas sp.]|uniref:hypothetical protein n=1 Tax=Armatimonas sp. TaxID=1872638 RepID=UPI00286BE88D|nr:hypothetical protein [Armatimonas sp.]